MATKVKSCTCKHEFQDKEHGDKQRVHNKTTKTSGQSVLYRCTVCGSEK